MFDLSLYTDGSCKPNPGRGGWGCVLLKSNGKNVRLNGSSNKKTTNTRMELTAIIKGLEYIIDKFDRIDCDAFTNDIYIYCDSQFIVNVMIRGFQARKNLDLFDEIEDLCCTLDSEYECDIYWEWVEAHWKDDDEVNAYWNNMADELANDGRNGVVYNYPTKFNSA